MRPRRLFTPVVMVLVSGFLILVPAGQALAASITVNTLDDELNSDGDCALREAIQAANTNIAVDACTAGSGTDTINLPFGTLQLSIGGSNEQNNQTGDLDISEGVTIVGTGASTAVNAASAGDRAFDVHTGIVSISALKVQNGSASGGTAPGGNILNHATLTVSNVTVEDGTGNAGGGIYNAPSATLTLSNSSLVGAPTGNAAVLGGGLNNDGNATVTTTTIGGSSVTAGGGGIFNNGTMSITGSTITGNDGGTNGGGILNGASGTLSMTTTNVTNNSASDHPGVANDGTLDITGGTISGNAATGGGCGGGLWNTGELTADGVNINSNSHGCGAGFANGGNATLTNSVVSNNTAADGPGGIGNDGSLTLIDTTVSGNSATQGGGIENVGDLTLDGSDVTGNTADSNGGILNGNGGSLDITNGSTINGNTSTGCCTPGGGLMNDHQAFFTMDASTVDGNTANDGGGVSNEGIGTITNSTVSDNVASGFNGGGVLNSGGKLTIDGTAITGNEGLAGAGVQNGGGGVVNLTNTTVSNNTGEGGVGIDNGASMTVVGSTISNNVETGNGGGAGIRNGGHMTLEDSTVSGNTGANTGGGISNDPDVGPGPTMVIRGSTISGNSAQLGGGIFHRGAMTVVNSTISGNSAGFEGGAIWNADDGVASLRSTTISGNSGASEPGISNFDGTVSIKNTILANSTGTDCSGVLSSSGYNLVEDASGCQIIGNTTGNVVGEDPKLGPLANNGGSTLTHALLVGSPAFEAGSPSCPPPDTDQLGVSRPQFFRCDIGSTESEDLLGIVEVTVSDPATLLPTGRVTVSGTIFCGPPGDTFRVFVQANQASTGAISRIGAATGTCSGDPGDPWTVTLRRKAGSPAFQPGQVEVCFEARTLQGTTVIDRLTGCVTVGLVT